MNPASLLLHSSETLFHRLQPPPPPPLPVASLTEQSSNTWTDWDTARKRSTKRSYQLYADEHHDICSSPASPRCTPITTTTTTATATVEDMVHGFTSSVCTCSKNMHNNVDNRCSVCPQIRQKRMSQHSYVLPERPAKQLTPPPSQPSSPRRSYETLTRSMPSRNTSAGDIFASALSSPDSSNNSLFPPSMHRHSTRPGADSRRTSEASSITSANSSTSSPAHGPEVVRKPSRPATPDARNFDSGYAPMAAGFARLSRKSNEYGAAIDDPTSRGRASSVRPSLDLSARMFSGPA